MPLLCIFLVVAAVAAVFRSPSMVNQAAGLLGNGTLWFIKQVVLQLAYVSYMFLGYCFYQYWVGRFSVAKLAAVGATFWLFSLLIFWIGELPTRDLRRMALSQFIAISMFGGSALMADWFKPNRILDGLAAISYPLYTTHLIVGWATLSWCLSNGAAPWIALLVALALTLLAAWCLHRAVEKPAVAFTKWWLARQR